MPFIRAARQGPRANGTANILLIRDARTKEYIACDAVPDYYDVDGRARELFTYFSGRDIVQYHVNTALLTVREILP